jgi:flagellar L-ring protein precursor FlgH
MKPIHATTWMWLLAAAGPALAQSSSLYVTTQPGPIVKVKGRSVNAQLQEVSYHVVTMPEPRLFAVHDLITIIIREQSTTTSEATLDTQKETQLDGKIQAFPTFNLRDILEGRLRPGDPADFPAVKVGTKNEFKGEGEYERRDTMTTRLTARVVDIKPNGTMTLEARTHVQNDDEKLTIAVTGQIRPEDVTADNTVLSTQVFDLRVAKVHEGELRKTSKKGLLTKILDTIFNF